MSAFDKSKMNAIDAFKGIHGVGDEKAKQLYEKGYRSIKGLRAKRSGSDGKEVLTKIQSIGLDHYEDLQHKIPRKEVEKISKTVSKAVQSLFKDKVHMTTCGSFRRGRKECGDVDILLSSDDTSVPVSSVLPKLISMMEKSGFLQARLGADKIA